MIQVGKTVKIVMELEKKCVNYNVLKFVLCFKKIMVGIFWVKIDKIPNRAQKND